jgi:hypothetical protein
MGWNHGRGWRRAPVLSAASRHTPAA